MPAKEEPKYELEPEGLGDPAGDVPKAEEDNGRLLNDVEAKELVAGERSCSTSNFSWLT
jgi:hypothetical protein